MAFGFWLFGCSSKAKRWATCGTFFFVFLIDKSFYICLSLNLFLFWLLSDKSICCQSEINFLFFYFYIFIVWAGLGSINEWCSKRLLSGFAVNCLLWWTIYKSNASLFRDLRLIWLWYGITAPHLKLFLSKKNKNSSHPNNHAIIRNFGKASRHLLLFLFFWYILILLFFSKKKKEKKIDIIIRWAKQQIQNMPPVHKLKDIIKKMYYKKGVCFFFFLRIKKMYVVIYKI